MTGDQDRESAGRGAVAALASLIDGLPAPARDQALTHSSWVEHRHHSWGRLAFLGDSVLGLAVATELYRRFTRSDIGRLTKIHGQAVSGRACAEVAVWLDVPAALAERAAAIDAVGISVGELVASERAMASITEALIGAVYLERGAAATEEAVLAAFEPQIELASETMLDFKSALQERLARSGRVVSYVVVEESGPPHARRFSVEAQVDGTALGSGVGPSKKAAEQAAASVALAGQTA